MKLIPQNYSLWVTSLLTPNKQELNLCETYSPEKYQVYDNYKAINVNSPKLIPIDYYGEMGVPVNIVRYSMEDYELIGKLQGGTSLYDYAKPIIDGKEKYIRLIIKRK